MVGYYNLIESPNKLWTYHKTKFQWQKLDSFSGRKWLLIRKKGKKLFWKNVNWQNSIESIWLGRLLLMIFVLGNHQPIAILLKMILIVFIVDLLSAQNWPFFIRSRWFIKEKWKVFYLLWGFSAKEVDCVLGLIFARSQGTVAMISP